MQQSKVFAIGLSKTGTTSLTRALKVLGFKTKHFPFFSLRYSSTGVKLNYNKILKFDAFTDSPIALFYKELDHRFPGSKFILTLRNQEAWLKSCENSHVWPGDFVSGKGASKLPLVRRVLKLHRQVFGTEKFDRKCFQESYESHLAEVKEYFKERESDLLILDICRGDGWKELCQFLEKDIPKIPFPQENVGLKQKYKKKSKKF